MKPLIITIALMILVYMINTYLKGHGVSLF